MAATVPAGGLSAPRPGSYERDVDDIASAILSLAGRCPPPSAAELGAAAAGLARERSSGPWGADAASLLSDAMTDASIRVVERALLEGNGLDAFAYTAAAGERLGSAGGPRPLSPPAGAAPTLPLLLDAALASPALPAPSPSPLALACSLLEAAAEATPVHASRALVDLLNARSSSFRTGQKGGQAPSLSLLRTCNGLLKRASREGAGGAEACGRVLALLAKLFPLTEKSGLNLLGAVDTAHVARIEEVDDSDRGPKSDEEGGSPAPARAGADAEGEGEGETASEGGGSTPGPEAAGREGAAEAAAPPRLPPAPGPPLPPGFYELFWGLQSSFAAPGTAARTVPGWEGTERALKEVLARLDVTPISTAEGAPGSAASSLGTSLAYLSSRRLLGLQLGSEEFRRDWLLQALVFLRAGSAPPTRHEPRAPLPGAAAASRANLERECWRLLARDGQEGGRLRGKGGKRRAGGGGGGDSASAGAAGSDPAAGAPPGTAAAAAAAAAAPRPPPSLPLAAAALAMLRGEDLWAAWKAAGCPPEGLSLPESARPDRYGATPPIPPPRERAPSPPWARLGISMGSETLSKLWNQSASNAECLEAEDRGGFRSLHDLLSPAIDALHEERESKVAGRPDDSPLVELNADPVYVWKSLRALSRGSLRAFAAVAAAGGDLGVAARAVYPSECPEPEKEEAEPETEKEEAKPEKEEAKPESEGEPAEVQRLKGPAPDDVDRGTAASQPAEAAGLETVSVPREGEDAVDESASEVPPAKKQRTAIVFAAPAAAAAARRREEGGPRGLGALGALGDSEEDEDGRRNEPVRDPPGSGRLAQADDGCDGGAESPSARRSSEEAAAAARAGEAESTSGAELSDAVADRDGGGADARMGDSMGDGDAT